MPWRFPRVPHTLVSQRHTANRYLEYYDKTCSWRCVFRARADRICWIAASQSARLVRDSGVSGDLA